MRILKHSEVKNLKEVSCGKIVETTDGITAIAPDVTDNGVVFKDNEAYENGKGVCYVSEYELDDLDEAFEYNGETYYLPNDECWTRKKIFDCAKEHLASAYDVKPSDVESLFPILDDEADNDEVLFKSLKDFCDDAFGECDWQSVETEITEMV